MRTDCCGESLCPKVLLSLGQGLFKTKEKRASEKCVEYQK